ncbi:MAG TPA: exodeoxyribonuclease VII small subunit [Gammaproteobacteria bacterium]|nr:exodeoxyribonuclease VII small subunit [Gammaproteobacteria bacterium]
MANKKSDEFNFEAALAELNQLVEKMERGGINLEESLHDFEKGINLTRQCQLALKTAEQKVQMLLEKNGELILSPYEPNLDENQ